MLLCEHVLGEAMRLEVSDVDLASGVLLIRESKNGNDRYVPMAESLTKCCQAYGNGKGAGKAKRPFCPVRLPCLVQQEPDCGGNGQAWFLRVLVESGAALNHQHRYT